MTLQDQILTTLGLAQLVEPIELGYHGDEWGDNTSFYRWNPATQTIEYRGKYSGTWQRSKHTSLVIKYLRSSDYADFVLSDDWEEHMGPYQRWSVFDAMRRLGITPSLTS